MLYFMTFLVYNTLSGEERELIALLLLSSRCHVVAFVICFFSTVLWVGLQCVSVALPGHTHILLNKWLYITARHNVI